MMHKIDVTIVELAEEALNELYSDYEFCNSQIEPIRFSKTLRSTVEPYNLKIWAFFISFKIWHPGHYYYYLL